MRKGERLLVILSYGLSVRYAHPTGLLHRLASVCDPVVGVGWDDPELFDELARGGQEVLRLPDAQLEHSYRRFRRRIGAVHERALSTPTWPIRRRRDRDAVPDRLLPLWYLRSARDSLEARVPGAASRLREAEPEEIASGTNVDAFARFLDEHRIDAVMSLTPYHDQDTLMLWAAQDLDRPSVTSVISFDNPTTRGRLPVRSERTLVWNRFNVGELLRSHSDLDPSRVGAIGAVQFDLHHRKELVVDRSEWARRLGIDADRPVILYGAGPINLVPGERELVHQIDAAITSGSLRGDPFLLVRPHPVDLPESWDTIGRQLHRGKVAPPWHQGAGGMRSWPTEDELVGQMSTLHHGDVHVNICSSMSLDGAMFGRPQVGPMFTPEQTRTAARRVRDLYRQEHWAPIQASGGVHTASDSESLVAAISEGLDRPEVRSAGRRRMVDQVVGNNDGCSAERLAREISQLST